MSALYDAVMVGFVVFGLCLNAASSGLFGYEAFKFIELIVF